MQPERDRGGTSEEDRRLKPIAPENQQQHQQQPQKCPRCESLNTKFCYYNNYSLSQPRYFCKTCRRYWTQGGTLRNVPVGGGCRKGKRAKTSSSGENSRSQAQPPPPPQPPSQAHQQMQQNLTTPSTIMSSSPVMATSPAGMRTIEPGALPSQYYPGAGYFSSLATIQSLNQPQTFNHQALDVGSELGSSSNMSLLQGFNVSTFGSQHQQPHQIQSSQFYQMSNRDKSNIEPLYPSEENLLQSAGRHASSSPHDHWAQSFMNNSTTSTASESSLWNMGNNTNTATGSVHTKTTTTSGPSFNPNQWSDLPGYGPPP
ncbi:hypothetical protein FNV43_RR07549 [Rhamnella rubrinervis]|uniref:Dof zinc finger protein n=1 Tax=Rhamnella rubrinervis TaxID=2594499 RepID=A0A8K0HGT0_9ROSA|nr:hypothetical protein FNV43_RR07549 [Rhamnella rubrinervis]